MCCWWLYKIRIVAFYFRYKFSYGLLTENKRHTIWIAVIHSNGKFILTGNAHEKYGLNKNYTWQLFKNNNNNSAILFIVFDDIAFQWMYSTNLWVTNAHCIIKIYYIYAKKIQFEISCIDVSIRVDLVSLLFTIDTYIANIFINKHTSTLILK